MTAQRTRISDQQKNFALVWAHQWPDVYQFAIAQVIARYSMWGYCNMRQKTIAARLKISRSKLQSSLAAMAEDGTVRLEAVRREDGGSTTNRIFLTLVETLSSTDGDTLVGENDFHTTHPGPQDEQGVALPAYDPGPPGGHQEKDSLRESLKETGLPSTSGILPSPESDVMEAWNTMASANGLKAIASIKGQRLSRLHARLKDQGLANVYLAIAMIPRSRFLLGLTKGDRKWRADFDFLLQESKFAKLIEGGYDDEDAGPAPATVARQPTILERIAADGEVQEGLMRVWYTDPAHAWPPTQGPPPGAVGCVIAADRQVRWLGLMGGRAGKSAHTPPPGPKAAASPADGAGDDADDDMNALLA